MGLKAIGDKVVVLPMDADEVSQFGIIIPDMAQKRPFRGTVVAVGPGRIDDSGEKRIPPDIELGDIVLYGQYGGAEVTYENETYVVLSERDILVVVT